MGSASPTTRRIRRRSTTSRKGFTFLRGASCDILVTPHPEASDLWGRIAKRDAGERDALIDRSQCARYADRADAQLQKRLATERAK